jgi:hypothetical protein
VSTPTTPARAKPSKTTSPRGRRKAPLRTNSSAGKARGAMSTTSYDHRRTPLKRVTQRKPVSGLHETAQGRRRHCASIHRSNLPCRAINLRTSPVKDSARSRAELVYMSARQLIHILCRHHFGTGLRLLLQLFAALIEHNRGSAVDYHLWPNRCQSSCQHWIVRGGRCVERARGSRPADSRRVPVR